VRSALITRRASKRRRCRAARWRRNCITRSSPKPSATPISAGNTRKTSARTHKAHAVSNLSEDARERVYWKTLNKAERRVTESEPGFLLKENPYLLALAQDAEKPEGIQRADSKPLTSSERRKLRASFDVSNALKQLGVDKAGLDALTTATAEHRTVTNERESESNVKNRVKAFFD